MASVWHDLNIESSSTKLTYQIGEQVNEFAMSLKFSGPPGP
jgi:hypothetical protein